MINAENYKEMVKKAGAIFKEYAELAGSIRAFEEENEENPIPLSDDERAEKSKRLAEIEVSRKEISSQRKELYEQIAALEVQLDDLQAKDEDLSQTDFDLEDEAYDLQAELDGNPERRAYTW